MEKMCRICLKTFEKKGTELKSVFENENEVQIARKIQEISGVCIEEKDPGKICQSCYDMVKFSCDFINMIHHSNEKPKETTKKELDEEQEQKASLKVEPEDDGDDDNFFDTTVDDNFYVPNPFDYLNDDKEIKSEKENDESEDNDPFDDDFEEKDLTSAFLENQTENKKNKKKKEVPKREVKRRGKRGNKKSEKEEKEKEEKEKVEKEKEETEKEEKGKDKKKRKFKKPIDKDEDDDKTRTPSRTPDELMEMYSFLKLGKTSKTFFCTICERELTLFSQRAVTRHIETEKHQLNEQIQEKRKLGIETMKLVNHRYYGKSEPYSICEFCAAMFRERPKLYEHIRRFHTENPVLIECGVCNRQFKAKFQLNRHMTIHTGEKRFKCRYCDKAFRLCGSKIKHERRHTGVKPYKCACGKEFRANHVYKNHLKTHTGIKEFECITCNRQFTLKDQYIKHLKSKYHKKRADPAPPQENNFNLSMHIVQLHSQNPQQSHQQQPEQPHQQQHQQQTQHLQPQPHQQPQQHQQSQQHQQLPSQQQVQPLLTPEKLKKEIEPTPINTIENSFSLNMHILLQQNQMQHPQDSLVFNKN